MFGRSPFCVLVVVNPKPEDHFPSTQNQLPVELEDFVGVLEQLMAELMISVPFGNRHEMSIDLTEAIFGTEKEFVSIKLEMCKECSGTGARSGTSRRKCTTCGGGGQVMKSQQTPFGTFSQVRFFPSALIVLDISRLQF
jgi:hypothetical protein